MTKRPVKEVGQRRGSIAEREHLLLTLDQVEREGSSEGEALHLGLCIVGRSDSAR